MGKILITIAFVGLGTYGVLAFIAYFKEQNRRWAAHQPSFFDRFNWLGDWMRSYRNRR